MGRTSGTRRGLDMRSSALAEFNGLRAGEDVVFQLHLDLDTGVVVRISRADLGLILRVDDLRIGSVEDAP
jgi:hypothetical protein